MEVSLVSFTPDRFASGERFPGTAITHVRVSKNIMNTDVTRVTRTAHHGPVLLHDEP